MSFIYCPICERPSSPKAASCLGCGHPLAAPEPSRVQTVEQTSKVWKLVLLLSAAMMVVGAVGAAANLTRSHAAAQIYAGIFVVGLAVQLFARVGAYWFHG